jgi:hypothetical protein
MLYRFQITLHARPPGELATEATLLDGRECQRLIVPHEQIATPFAVSFEEAYAAMEALPRMFIEPDGSFVWVSSQGESPRWQLDGALYDRSGRLLYVDLKGECPPEAWDKLLGCVGAPPQAVMAQLVRQAVFLGEDDFRRFASTA